MYGNLEVKKTIQDYPNLAPEVNSEKSNRLRGLGIV